MKNIKRNYNVSYSDENLYPGFDYIQLYKYGFIVLSVLILQTFSGILLLFYYKPITEEAYYSLLYLNDYVYFGQLFRSIHAWSAGFLILSLLVYLLLIIFKNYQLKHFNLFWLSGAVILLLFYFSSFTGAVLPMDSRSYFSLTIASSELKKIPVFGNFISDIIKGSGRVGQESLSRIFAFHTGMIPFLIFVFVLIHYIILILNEKRSGTENNFNNKISSLKNIIINSLIYFVIIFAVIIVLSVLIPKSPGIYFDTSNPVEAPQNIKPEWYFLFVYALLKSEAFIPGILVQFFLICLLLYFTFNSYFNKLFLLKKNNYNRYIILTLILLIFILSVAGWLS